MVTGKSPGSPEMAQSSSSNQLERAFTARISACCVGLGLLCLLVLPVVVHAQTPVTNNPIGAAAAMIDTGDGEPIYVVVTLDDSETTAIGLLRTAGVPLVTVSFGGLGEAVCSISQTGCDVSTCRRRVCQSGDPESPFWQYWQQDDEGEWTLSPLGGSHASIEKGDIIAWVWTGVEPELARIGWEEIAARAGAPDAIVNGNDPVRAGVWMSDPAPDPSDDSDSLTGTLVSTGMLVLIAGAGLVLVRRQRMRTGPAAR